MSCSDESRKEMVGGRSAGHGPSRRLKEGGEIDHRRDNHVAPKARPDHQWQTVKLTNPLACQVERTELQIFESTYQPFKASQASQLEYIAPRATSYRSVCFG